MHEMVMRLGRKCLNQTRKGSSFERVTKDNVTLNLDF